MQVHKVSVIFTSNLKKKKSLIEIRSDHKIEDRAIFSLNMQMADMLSVFMLQMVCMHV